MRSKSWNTPDTWAALGTMLVLMQVSWRISEVAVAAGISLWVVAVVAAAIAVTAVVLFDNESGSVKGGVLFGVYLSAALAAVLATGEALDVWAGWVMFALLALVFSVRRLRARHREHRPA